MLHSLSPSIQSRGRSLFSTCFLAPLLFGLGACATAQMSGPQGATSGKIMLEGRPYSLSHKGARPDAKTASDGISGSGGEIAGTICGSDLMMLATHHGDHVRVSGFIDNQWNANMQIKQADGFLVLTGSMANYGYELRLFADRLIGAVGRCRVDMQQDPADRDRLVQHWNVQGVDRTTSVRGIEQLWSLPAAQQAVLLPILTQCLFGQFFSNNLNTSPEVQVGGVLGSVPRDTITWSGSRMNSYCGG